MYIIFKVGRTSTYMEYLFPPASFIGFLCIECTVEMYQADRICSLAIQFRASVHACRFARGEAESQRSSEIISSLKF